MRKALLDTSFVLTAVRQNVDFFRELEEMGFVILIPKQTLRELESMKKSEKGKVKANAELALKVVHAHGYKLVEIEGKNTDNAIINFAKENPRAAIATLDSEIKKKVKNQKIVIRRGKRVDVV